MCAHTAKQWAVQNRPKAQSGFYIPPQKSCSTLVGSHICLGKNSKCVNSDKRECIQRSLSSDALRLGATHIKDVADDRDRAAICWLHQCIVLYGGLRGGGWLCESPEITGCHDGVFRSQSSSRRSSQSKRNKLFDVIVVWYCRRRVGGRLVTTQNSTTASQVWFAI